MNAKVSLLRRMSAMLAFAVLTASALLFSACHKGPAADPKTASTEAPATNATAEGADEGVSLKPEEIQAMGIETTEAKAIQSTPEAPGFAVILAHETVAAAVAELRTAMAAAHQSHSALERTKRLAGTPGAMPADTQETAERQAVADEAALELSRQRLSSTFGQDPPWKKSDNDPQLLALASGQAKLIHVTFALNSLGDLHPTRIRLARIDTSQGGRSWQSDLVWNAPADATVPGRSYFVILQGSDLAEGDHLLAWAPTGEAESGVLIPAAAAIISGGKFWCFVEVKPGNFVRTEFDPGRAVADGYFVKDGISVGARIVTAAAGQLLARETNPGKEPE